MTGETSGSAAVGYASGNFAKSLQWNTVELLYLFFLVDVVGIPPAVAGIVILVSLVWDGVSDPLVGFLIDRWGSRIGSYQTMILIAAPFSAASFLLIFLFPQVIGNSPLFGAILASLLFRTGYTLVDVPHNALLAAISHDSKVRGRIAVYRYFFSALGGVGISLLIGSALNYEGVGERAFQSYAMAISAIYILVMLSSAQLSKRARVQHRLARPTENVTAAIRHILLNTRLLYVLSICALSACLIPIFNKFAVFFAKSWLGDANLAAYLIMANSIGQMLALPAWNTIAINFEKRAAAYVSHGLLAASMFFFLLLTPTTLLVSVIFFIVAGFAMSGIHSMNWAMIPDTLEYTQAQFGYRHEGTTFGVLSMVIKVFAGLSLALTGWALELAGYNSDPSVVSDQLNGILLSMAVAPAFGSLSCIGLLFCLRLSHAEHSRLLISLHK